MLVAVLVLAGVVALLWKRLSDVMAQQAQLSLQYRELRHAHEALERRWRGLTSEARDAPSGPQAATPAPPIVPSKPVAAASPPPAVFPPAATSARPAATAATAPDEGRESLAGASRWVVEFFTTGNVVAKAGVVVVFFGVAFLLRYAAERGMLPIEYRLMSTAAGAIVLLAVGWRLRHSRREYAVVLQGGAVGVLYLTIFAAFRLYALLPAPLTFALLLMVVAFSAVLAVAQNAMSLAVLGSSGGYLAPILASTGSGSHVALFSYYAALNAGVVGIAWFRAWRFLNWLAFVFTFGIGFIWGGQYYQPALFATTEPFLVLFFLLFVASAVIFAHRQPPQLRGYIDGTLVFGAPAVAFGMQSVLVRDIPFGRAYSAVVLSALYLALTRLLWRRDAALRPLAEAFLALAAVFLILAVPLAFDGHGTAAAWALEGAGLIWIGLRQHRRLARLAGAALLLGAGAAFAVMAAPSAPTPVLNTRFLGCVAIAAGSIVAGRLMSQARDTLSELERRLEWVLLAWGLVWWFGAVTFEIAEHVQTRFIPAAVLLAWVISGGVTAILARGWGWRAMMHATIPIGPLSWLSVVLLFLLRREEGPLPDLGWLAWTVVVAINYLLLFWFERIWPSAIVRTWHAATAWLTIFLTTWTVAVLVRQIVPETSTWSFTVWSMVPALFVLCLRGPAASLAWPVGRFPSLYAEVIPGAPVVASLLWVLRACVERGSAQPLPYVPLLNPLELAQAFALLTAYAWWKDSASNLTRDEDVRSAGRAVLAVLAFLASNALVSRIVHFYLNVPFDLETLLASAIFQTGISILWGVVAGLLMTASRRRLDRPVWMVGAGLLAALILKLFVVDLGNVGGVARIVSFLATGVLILLIGYFAPVPPRGTKPEREQTT
jgi:uncharacterized membrane protein